MVALLNLIPAIPDTRKQQFLVQGCKESSPQMLEKIPSARKPYVAKKEPP